MNRPRLARPILAVWLLPLTLIFSATSTCSLAADPPAASAPKSIGKFFRITEPITSESNAQLRAATKQFIDQSAAKGTPPILVFEFVSGEAVPGGSDFGVAFDLAELIATRMGGAKRTVAYVANPLKGPAVLAALMCHEIVLGKEASLGPITTDGEPVRNNRRQLLRDLAAIKGHDPDLLIGMLDRDADLRIVRTGNKQLEYVLAENLDEFRKSNQVVEDHPAWEGGQRGVLSASRAREQGFAKLIASSTAEIVQHYNLAGEATVNDPTLGQDLKPVWIQVHGPIDTVKTSFLRSWIEQARQEHVNLVLFQFNSLGGLDTAADSLADMILSIKDMKTVAFIDDRALGLSVLPVFACDQIVFRRGSQMGDVQQIITDRNGGNVDLDARTAAILGRKVSLLAEEKGHPAAIARAMIEPDSVVYEATDSRVGARCYVLASQLREDPARYLNPEERKSAGQVLTVSGEKAETFGLGQVVSDVEEFKGLFGLRGKNIRVDGPTWVHALVTVLTTPVVSWLLLFVGLFMLVLELKLPGIGLPAILSCLAFLLFFWSHYLSGTADQLEIILFLAGMVSLALELFVFPGFGVFGMSGVLLILTSIVMASHTFVWPSRENEYREMGITLVQVTAAMISVGVGAAILARFFPSLPLFNRLILKPEPWTGADSPNEFPEAKPSLEGYDSLAFLVGETGRTTTVLRPFGKARFGQLLIDVSADGFFIEPDSLVEVVDVQGSRVIVKRVGA